MDRTLLININWNIVYPIVCNFIIREKHLKHTFHDSKNLSIYYNIRFTTEHLGDSAIVSLIRFWFIHLRAVCSHQWNNDAGVQTFWLFYFPFFSCTFFFYLCVSDSRKTINNPWVRLQSHHPLDQLFVSSDPRKPPDTDHFCLFFLFLSLSFFLSLSWMSKIGETHEQCTIERERKKPYQWIFLPLYVFSVFYWPWKFTNHFSHRLY